MKIRIWLVLVVMFLAIAGNVCAAAEDRFKGASFDGYDSRSLIQIYDYSSARFKGASRDGYDVNMGYDLAVPLVVFTQFTFF